MRTIFIASSQKSKKGNLTVTTGSGETFFLHQNKAEGKTVDGAWATIVSKNYKDANGAEFTRSEVAALFATEEIALQAVNAEAIFNIKSASLVQTAASTAGLSQTAIDALLQASI
jgi:hypothetical protein